ncbi:hypothetical protein F5X68DRAFT_204194 [Plectosphaerella plurivora]|uniref:Uncharacterized protein n=1 Tax=Plectosphaerella plurivora TaxID=936078 RepID=A0A9P8VG70_9PEZI|nr:hypothetical protein F5X68DRAFT_204194 [Plectosphaerella plurivora]
MPSPRRLPRIYGVDRDSRRRSNNASESPQRRHFRGRLLLERARCLSALHTGDAPASMHCMDDLLVAYHSAAGIHGSASAQCDAAAAQGRTLGMNKQDQGTDSQALADSDQFVGTPETLGGGLPCPFAEADSGRYSQCYAHTMLTNGAVARHLRKQHRQPLYCPTCRATFQSRTLRDGHIRLRKCKLAESIHLEGLDIRQFDSLKQFIHTSDASRATWDQISQLVSIPSSDYSRP